jgi:hypothetical protein
MSLGRLLLALGRRIGLFECGLYSLIDRVGRLRQNLSRLPGLALRNRQLLFSFLKYSEVLMFLQEAYRNHDVQTDLQYLHQQYSF